MQPTRRIENAVAMSGKGKGMFESFDDALINSGETTVFTRKGTGPPLLLLHSFPKTHLMWHAIAPGLADTFTVICVGLARLRGERDASFDARSCTVR